MKPRKDSSPRRSGQAIEKAGKTENGSLKWKRKMEKGNRIWKLEEQNGKWEVNLENGKTKWKLEGWHLSATVLPLSL